MVLKCIVEFLGSRAARPAGLGKRPRDKARENPAAALLSAVPGVGASAAQALSAAFPSASALVAATEAELAATALNEKRKVGRGMAKAVKEFFF